MLVLAGAASVGFAMLALVFSIGEDRPEANGVALLCAAMSAGFFIGWALLYAGTML